VQAGDAGLMAEVGGPAADHKFGLAHGVGDHLHLPPADAVPAQADAQGLGEGLLGSEAQGKGGVAPAGLALAIGDFLGGEDAVQEALAVALDGGGDTGYLDQIDSDTIDHKGSFEFRVFSF